MENKQSFYGGGSKSFYGVINSYGDINNLYEEKTITGPVNIASFNDGLKNKKIKQLIVAVEPQQDLHGYANPWPAGGGVNKFVCGDAVGVSVSTGASYGLTITCDGTSETITISGNPTWTSASAKSFRILSTHSESYYGNAPVNHDYYGLNGKFFVVSKSSNISNINSEALMNSDGTIGITLTNSDTAAVSIVLRLVIYSGSTAPTSWSPYSNLCPITGHTAAGVETAGRNLLDDTGIYTSASVLSWSIQGATGDGILLKKGVTYTLSYNGTTIVDGIYIYRKNTNEQIAVKYNNTSLTYTPTQDIEVGFSFYWANQARPSTATHIMLELGSTATSYVPYSGSTYSISWQTEAGTVYGGSLDVTTGVLTVDRAMITVSADDIENSTITFRWIGVSGLRDIVGAGVNGYLDSQMNFSGESRFGANTFGSNNVMFGNINNFGNGHDFKANNHGLMCQVLFPLATPQTYQLTPTQITTLLGENNVWADTGPVEKLVYIAKKE